MHEIFENAPLRGDLSKPERGLLQHRLWWNMLVLSNIASLMLFRIVWLMGDQLIIRVVGFSFCGWFAIALLRACWMLRRVLDPTPRQIRREAKREAARAATAALELEKGLRSGS